MDAPPEFLYHLIDDNYRYRIDVWYMDEEFLPIAAKWSHPGIYWYKKGDTEENWTQTTSLTFERQTINFGNVKTEITIVKSEENNISYASFLWDNYIIEVRGNTVGNENVYDVINTDILPHLSFQKMPLNPTASTAPAESSTPQPSENLPEEEHSTEAPVSPTQIPAE